MTVFKAIATVCVEFVRSLGWLVGTALAGAAVSFIGGWLASGLTASLGDRGAASDMAEPLIFLPAIIAHAAFCVVISQTIVGRSSRAVRFGARQVRGIAVISLSIIALSVGATWLPDPTPFFLPLALAALLAWTPIVPAAVVGPVPWSWRKFATAVLVSLPFLALTEVFGFIPQAVATFSNEGFGMFEGGIITWPMLATHMFLASATAAIVPTVVYAGDAPRPSPDAFA